MLLVKLEQEDWNRVLAVLSQGPWNIVNPLIMAIGEQLRYQATAGAAVTPRPNGPDAEDQNSLGKGLNQA